MSSDTALKIFFVLIGLAIAGLVLATIVEQLRVGQVWRRLPDAPFPVRYYAPPGYVLNETLLRARLELVLTCLTRHGPWGTAELLRALAGVRIRVMLEETWPDARGRTVSGMALLDQSIIAVGPSCNTLLHELVHYAQWRIENKTNREHLGWAEDGLILADKNYREENDK